MSSFDPENLEQNTAVRDVFFSRLRKVHTMRISLREGFMRRPLVMKSSGELIYVKGVLFSNFRSCVVGLRRLVLQIELLHLLESRAHLSRSI
jgi:hypothetical protein